MQHKKGLLWKVRRRAGSLCNGGLPLHCVNFLLRAEDCGEDAANITKATSTLNRRTVHLVAEDVGESRQRPVKPPPQRHNDLDSISAERQASTRVRSS